jgi:hypothetical protein
VYSDTGCLLFVHLPSPAVHTEATEEGEAIPSASTFPDR